LLALHAIIVHLEPSYLGLVRPEDLNRRHGAGGFSRTAVSSPSNLIETGDGRRYLWAGKSPDDHFDVTEFRLNQDQLHYGLGRESFPALIEPTFVPAQAADQWFDGSDRVRVGDQARECVSFDLAVAA